MANLSETTNSPTTIATLSLPAGSYLVTAKARLVRSNNVTATCRLYAGNTIFDESAFQAGSSGALMTLHAPLTLTTTTTVTVRCSSSNNNTTASYRTLSAQAFTNLTVQ